MKNLYIHNLLKHFHKYIQHCSQCQLMQILQHKLYKSLQLILTFSQSFHTITVDFILILLKSSKKYKCIMLITDKFSKTVSFLFEKKTIIKKN